MATRAFTEPRINGDIFAGTWDHPAESLALPLAPTDTLASAEILLRRLAVTRGTSKEHPFDPREESDLPEAQVSFGPRRNLIACTAVVVALGVSALAYFFLAPTGEETGTQAAESAATVQSSPVAS